MPGERLITDDPFSVVHFLRADTCDAERDSEIMRMSHAYSVECWVHRK